MLLLFKSCVSPRVKRITKACHQRHKKKSKFPFINTRGAKCVQAYITSVRTICCECYEVERGVGWRGKKEIAKKRLVSLIAPAHVI